MNQTVDTIVDTTVPKAARVYDFFLGGHHHFDADRLAGEAAIAMAPFIPDLIKLQHGCLKGVAEELMRRNFDIIVDFASGLPTEKNIHHYVSTGTTVIYSDIDAETVAYSRQILGNTPNTNYFQNDIHQPDAFLNSQDVQAILQGRRDIAFVMWGITLFMDDDTIATVTRKLYDWADERCCLALNMPLAGVNPHNSAMARFLAAYDQMGEPVYPRLPESCATLVHPWKIDTQGCVSILDWHGIEPTSLPIDNLDAVGHGGGSYGGFLVK